LKYR
jgi:hypothetical protein